MPTLDLGNVMGPQGPQGSIWYFGTDIIGTSSGTFPNTEIILARQYDKYLNTSTGDIYTCTSEGDAHTAEWLWIGNMKGKEGNIGPVGPTGSVNANTPIEFSEAETLANIESGEAIAIIFGKTKKFFADILDGAVSNLLGENLTDKRVLVSDAEGKIKASTVTDTELDCLDGVKSNIQTQIDNLSTNLAPVSYTIGDIYTSLDSVATIGYARRIGNIVFMYIRVIGGSATANTYIKIGRLLKLKPTSNESFALAGNGNTSNGNVTIAASGDVSIMVDTTTSYYSASINYITNDF